MFPLILTIIAIVIVTALGLATFYYGGSAMRQGQEGAQAARVINGATQIQAAVTLYSVKNGQAPQGTQEEIKNALLSSNYLKSFPDTADWIFVDDYVTVQNLSDSQCLAINQKFGLDYIPTCSDVATLGHPACCTG